MTASEAEVARPAILLLGDRAAPVAARVAASLPEGELWAPVDARVNADERFTSVLRAVRELFAAGRPVVGICAAGILIRAVAPLLGDKRREPPVLAVAEDGSAVVPLLGGHRGANTLARRIAAALDVPPAVTTASDLRFGVAFDELPRGWRFAESSPPASTIGALLEGEPLRLVVESGDAGWLRDTALPWSPDGARELLVTHRSVQPSPARLVVHPPVLAVGVGAERGASTDALVGLVEASLGEAGLAARAVACVVSIELKVAEPAIHALGQRLGVPVRFVGAERLRAETERLLHPSAAVLAATGCWGVAEGAALAAAGPESTLIVPKRKGDRVTCAIALAATDIDPLDIGRARGRLAIVGLGPGDRGSRTREAETAIRTAGHVVGYGLYLDLAADLLEGKQCYRFPLGAEEERCRKALDLAAAGEQVVLLASGDAGIYAMASLVLELVDREERAEWARLELRVIPGISAMQAAAAAAGAPLGHDFCAISLSDLMTPWDVIERRLVAAAEADFVVAIYNPVSARRRAGLERARDLLLRQRPPETPVVVASALGRANERLRVVPLGELTPAHADMQTVLIVGSRSTRRAAHADEFVYTPRGYLA